MTDQEIVDKCNALARDFYRMGGYQVPDGYRFDEATHPQEQAMWVMACHAFRELLFTDPDDALTNID
jgi:hypothetical protein